jgi:hypothetical protein
MKGFDENDIIAMRITNLGNNKSPVQLFNHVSWFRRTGQEDIKIEVLNSSYDLIMLSTIGKALELKMLSIQSNEEAQLKNLIIAEKFEFINGICEHKPNRISYPLPENDKRVIKNKILIENLEFEINTFKYLEIQDILPSECILITFAIVKYDGEDGNLVYLRL